MISNRPDLIVITAENKGETELAVLLDNSQACEWVPKSQMEDWPDEGEYGEVVIKEWMAIEKEFI